MKRHWKQGRRTDVPVYFLFHYFFSFLLLHILDFSPLFFLDFMFIMYILIYLFRKVEDLGRQIQKAQENHDQKVEGLERLILGGKPDAALITYKRLRQQNAGPLKYEQWNNIFACLKTNPPTTNFKTMEMFDKSEEAFYVLCANIMCIDLSGNDLQHDQVLLLTKWDTARQKFLETVEECMRIDFMHISDVQKQVSCNINIIRTSLSNTLTL